MRTTRCFGWLVAILLCFIDMQINNAQATVPDFAYPRTVVKDSRLALERAIAAGNEKDALRAVIDMEIARNMIELDSASAVIEAVVNVVDGFSDPSCKAIGDLLIADIYQAVYNSDRWNFDRREVPSVPLNADCLLWSGEQFRGVIRDRIKKSVAPVDLLKTHPLREYKDLIEIDPGSAPYYPTLYDFIAARSIETLQQMDDIGNVMPLSRLTPVPVPNLYAVDRSSSDLIAFLYASLANVHREDAAPMIHNSMEWLSYVRNHLYDNGTWRENNAAYIRSICDLYEKWRESEWSGDILITLGDNIETSDLGSAYVKWLYDALQYNIGKFPSYWRLDQLKLIVKRLLLPHIDLNYRNFTSPGAEFSIDATLSNINDVILDVYNVTSVSSAPGNDNYISYSKISGCPRLDPVRLHAEGEALFTARLSASIKFSSPGVYVLVPRAAGTGLELPAYRHYQMIRVSSLSLMSYTDINPVVIAVNPFTGLPQQDVSVMMTPRRGKVPVSAGKTDGEGFLAPVEAVLDNYLYPIRGNDRYGSGIYVNKPPQNRDRNYSASIYTSLGLYHPGDSVDWTAVVFSSFDGQQRIEREFNVRAILQDVSGRDVDTLTFITDDWGRAYGRFKIPQECLTGYFSIRLTENNDNSDSRWLGRGRFMVSDYKMPEFKIITEKVQTGIPASGDVTLKGQVITYSGFPLSDCNIVATLSVGRRSRWSWMRPQSPIVLHTFTLKSNEEGKFVLELSDSLLSTSPIPNGLFSVTLKVTSAVGETHDATVVFARDKSYCIEASVATVIDRREPVELKLRLTDGKGDPADLPVDIRLIREDSTIVWSSELTPGLHTVDWSGVGSGTYILKASALGYDASEQVIDGIVLYTPEDRKSPVDRLLWSPVSNLTASGRKCSVLYATHDPEQCVLAVVSDSSGVISREWLNQDPGMHTYAVTLPAGSSEVILTLVSVKDFESEAVTVNIRNTDITPKVIIEVESMRDHIMAGATERWSIRVKSNTSDSVNAAIIARLYNAALDAVEASSWSLLPQAYQRQYFSFSTPYTGYRASTDFSGPQPTIKSWRTIGLPDWVTYGRPLYPGRMMRFNGMLKMAATSRAGNDDGIAEEAKVEEVMMDEVVELSAVRSASVAGANGVFASASVGEVYDAEAEVADEDGTDEKLPVGLNSDETYREGENPLAFFMPELTTGEDGSITIEFDLPEANTTWRFNALAYTKELLGDLFTADIVASKPVMVSANLPRFVRIGDRVSVESLVMNNSDTTLTVTTTAEFFDNSTGRIIGEITQSDTLAPGESVPVLLTADIVDGPVLGFRVKSVSGSCSDGEKELIGVLPSVDPVIDSYTFYIAPSDTVYEMSLPVLNPKSRADLQFCNDPLWYVVTALPGLQQSEMSTPADAAVSIFAGAVAEGLMNDFPRIGDALREWSKSDRSESALVSMLDRNSDLKIILLKATPWMLDAAGDTERMTRLSMLFDSEAIHSNRLAAITHLKKLTAPDGGWRWITQCEKSSLWATSQALSVLCRLEWLGYMPKDKELVNMINGAVKYADNEMMAEFARNPKQLYLNYVFVRSMFRSIPQPSGVKAIVAATQQRAIRDWKDYSLIDKGVSAIILAEGGHKAVAGKILESVTEFSECTPERGMWWPSLGGKWNGSLDDIASTALLLEAFDRVKPGSEIVERICQWLILQKEGRDWRSVAPATMIIADILRVSDRWLESTGEVTLTLGGENIPVGGVEKYTGSIRVDLSQLEPSGKQLVINRTGEAPAWGSVLCRYDLNPADVKATSVDAVSIEKCLYIREDGASVYTDWTPDNVLRVGERVKVELIIKVSEAMDYVVIVDNRPACLEPIEQLPRPIWSEGICFYRENRDSSTHIFIPHLPKGVYRIGYDMWVNNAGIYTSGLATVQSQYAPQFTAHSAGTVMKCMK